jgi:hypothetical protein
MTARKSPPAIFVCPGCGTYGTIECFASGEDASEVQKMLARLPGDVGPALLSYLRLFAPRKQALTWARKRKLLAELMPLIEAQQIRRKGRDWPAPHAAWISAIRTMLDNRSMELPLTTHGYLLQVIVGEADKAEGQRERETEAERKAAAPRSYDDQAEAHRAFQLNVRNAKAFIVREQTLARTRFGEEYPVERAREFLEGRGYDGAVIGHVLIDVFGAAHASEARR